jgi:hypothetical protein
MIRSIRSLDVKKALMAGAICASTLGAVGIVISPQASYATGTVPTDVQTGIDNATATVGALSGLSLAALVVALTPLGAMLTLRFLNMVLSRV